MPWSFGSSSSKSGEIRWQLNWIWSSRISSQPSEGDSSLFHLSTSERRVQKTVQVVVRRGRKQCPGSSICRNFNLRRSPRFTSKLHRWENESRFGLDDT
jgi:hypothetical protein